MTSLSALRTDVPVQPNTAQQVEGEVSPSLLSRLEKIGQAVIEGLIKPIINMLVDVLKLFGALQSQESTDQPHPQQHQRQNSEAFSQIATVIRDLSVLFPQNANLATASR